MLSTVFRVRALASVVLTGLACGHAAPERVVAVRDGSPKQCLTEAEYIRELPPSPAVVGFDVDDTALFSTPAFLYAKGRLRPEPPSQSGRAEDQVAAWRQWDDAFEKNREALFEKFVTIKDPSGLTEYERQQHDQFWRDVNGNGDEYSPPKVLVRRLISRHVARGDQVIFVTGRSEAETHRLSAKLRKDFHIDHVRVEFTANRPKDDAIRRLAITTYYGDSDADMTDAAAAGAATVRILRSPYSSNEFGYSPGTKGEKFVICDSEL